MNAERYFSNNLINILNSVDNNEEYFFDNLHISSAGNLIVANEIYEILIKENLLY